MKKGKRLITLFAILLVLVVGATSLVACTDKKGKKMSAEDFTNMLNNGVQMSVSPSDGWYFNVDAKVSVTYEKDAVKSKYDLIVRGTLDTNPEAQDKHDNQIFLQLNETKGAEPTTTLLGLYYSEKECNSIDTYAKDAPQLYIELGGKYKFAYDTYSIKKLIRDITPPTANAAGIGEDIKGLVPQIFTQLAVPKTYKIKKIDKKTVQTTVDLDITRLIRESVDFEEMKNGKPTGKLVQGQGILYGLIKDNSEMIDGIIGVGTAEKPGLGLDLTADKLLNLDIQMPMTLTCQYESAKKGSFGKFKNAALNINIAKDHDITIKMGEEYIVSGDMANNPILPFPTLIPKCNLTIAVEKMEIASGEKLALEFPDFKSFKKVGIANIDISGKVTASSSDPKNTKVKERDLIIKADINPIPLAFITSNTDVKQKVFESIGMLHIAIADPLIGDRRAAALLEIVYDPDSTGGDYAYVSINIADGFSARLRMDASSLEGLFNVMVDFITPPKPAPAPAGILDTVADGAINNVAPDLGVLLKDICNETLKSVLSMIPSGGTGINAGKNLWEFDLDGVAGGYDTVDVIVGKIGKLIGDLTTAENGAVKLGTVERKGQDNAFVELNLKKILDAVGGAFGLDKGLLTTIQGLIPSILGGDVLNIEFTGISYGTVPKDYDAAFNIKKGTNGWDPKTCTAKVIGETGKNGVITMTKAQFEAKYMKIGTPIKLDIVNIAGAKTTNDNYGTYFVAGYDKAAGDGEQEVTIVVKATDTGIDGILGAIGSLVQGLDLSKYPLGFESFKMKVNFKG